MQTSLIINTTDANDKALQKTVTFVNADCSASVLKTAAQKLNSLTTNTYVKSMRIDKTNVDTASDKQTRTISGMKVGSQAVTIEGNTISATLPQSELDANHRFYLRFFDDSVQQKNGSLPVWSSDGSVSYSTGANYNSATWPYAWALFIALNDASATSVSGTLDLPPNDYYNGESYNVNITISGGE